MEVYPQQLRLLVVDNDPNCVKILPYMLTNCNYKVTEVETATDAIEALNQNPKGFDMVITDISIDINVLSLVVSITTILNIPVIIVSGSEDTTALIKELQIGADEILSKPVSLAKIKTLWQHVYRRRLITNSAAPVPADAELQLVSSSPLCSDEGSESTEDDGRRNSRIKKRRVRWSGKLQERFMEAVVQLGGPEKAVPRAIMEKLNAPEVSRESVASHLQMYRKNKKPLLQLTSNCSSIVSCNSSMMTQQPDFQFDQSVPDANAGNLELFFDCQQQKEQEAPFEYPLMDNHFTGNLYESSYGSGFQLEEETIDCDWEFIARTLGI